MLTRHTCISVPSTSVWIYPFFTEFVHQLRTESEKYGHEEHSRRRGKNYSERRIRALYGKLRKIRRLRSLPTDCCKVDLEVYTGIQLSPGHQWGDHIKLHEKSRSWNYVFTSLIARYL